MKKFAPVFISLIISVILFGCAAGTQQVRISYVAEPQASRAGKGEVIIVNKAADLRPSKELVGGAKNWIGMTRTDVQLQRNVELSSIISTQVADIINLNGYDMRFPGEKLKPEEAAQAKTLDTKILNFWTESRHGISGASVKSSETLEFELKDLSGKVIWKKTISEKESERVEGSAAADFNKPVNNMHDRVMKEFEAAVRSPEFINAVEGR